MKDVIEQFAESDVGDRVWIDAEGIDRTVRVEVGEEMHYTAPDHRDEGWDEGSLMVEIWVGDEYVDECDLAWGYGKVRSETNRGQWRKPRVTLAEEWVGGESMDDVDSPWSDWEGEEREMDVRRVVPEWVWEMRETAIERAEMIRAKSVQRVVLMDAYVRYCSRVGAGMVWQRYVHETGGEPSLEGFLDWLGEDTAGQLLIEAANVLFDDLGELDGGVLDVSGRTAWDAVFALQHFRCEE